MQNNFGNLDSVLDKYLQRKGLKSKASTAKILFEYEQLLSTKIPQKSAYKAKKLQDKILYISVTDSAWAQKINFQNPEILKTLQENHPHKISNIRIMVENLT